MIYILSSSFAFTCLSLMNFNYVKSRFLAKVRNNSWINLHSVDQSMDHYFRESYRFGRYALNVVSCLQQRLFCEQQCCLLCQLSSIQHLGVHKLKSYKLCFHNLDDLMSCIYATHYSVFFIVFQYYANPRTTDQRNIIYANLGFCLPILLATISKCCCLLHCILPNGLQH